MYKESLKHLIKIPVKADLTFYLAVAILIYFQGFAAGIMYSILFLSALIVHEYAHAFSGIQAGLKVKFIEFNALGAATTFDTKEPLYDNEKGLTIALAGPIASAIYLCMSAAVNIFFHNSMSAFFLGMNVLIIIINMLPVLTFDGGLALFILLKKNIGKDKAIDVCYKFSIIICLIAIICSIIFSIYIITFLAVIAWFCASIFRKVVIAYPCNDSTMLSSVTKDLKISR